MLKILLIFALALPIFPVQADAQTNKAQQASQSNKPSSPVAPIAIEHRDSPTLQPEHHEHIQADVRVISTPSKDGHDVATFWANIVLVLVGVGGIVVASITLCRIHRQAVEMRLQRILMQRTLGAIRRQAELMEHDFRTRINKESARIFVRRTQTDSRFIDPTYESPEDSTGGLNADVGVFSVEFSNQGESKAYSVEWFCKVEVIGNDGSILFREVAGERVGVVKPNSDPFEGTVEIYPLPNGAIRESIINQTATLRFSGRIRYETAFEPLKSISVPFGWTWIEDSEWIDEGAGFADTSHWEEDTADQQNQSQNPN